MTKRDYIVCDICGQEHHHDTDWSETFDGKSVCEACADSMPNGHVFSIDHYELGDCYYGNAERDTEEISTGFYKLKADAEKRLVEMCLKLWGSEPIEED